MVGTPAYMAPEQYLATAADARTDQFSFCVAFYEALYGERPFAGNNYALTNNVVQGKVGTRPRTRCRAGCARWCCAACGHAAADRFPSMAAMLDA